MEGAEGREYCEWVKEVEYWGSLGLSWTCDCWMRWCRDASGRTGRHSGPLPCGLEVTEACQGKERWMMTDNFGKGIPLD